MIITHILEDFTREGGGIPVMVASQIQWQAAAGWDVALLQTSKEYLSVPDGVRVVTCRAAKRGRAWRWSPCLNTSIRGLLAERKGIVHIHGIWTAPQYLAARHAKKMNIPYIVSPHGQLMPALASSAGGETSLWKKRFYRVLIANNLLRRASILHAITNVEADIIRITCPNSRIKTVPHGVDIEMANKATLTVPDKEKTDKKKTILFLGRLDFRKGIELLIRAFSRAELPDSWRLVIAGPDDHPGYRRTISALIQSVDCRNRIIFRGPVFGTDKWQQYLEADLFCLPSSSEVMGLVNLEAALCSLPVLTTPQAGLEGWQEAGGMVIDAKLDDWTEALKKAISWSDEKRQKRGAQLKAWVCQRYSSEKIQNRWIETYKSLL